MKKIYIGTFIHLYESRSVNYYTSVMYQHFVSYATGKHAKTFFGECWRFPVESYMVVIFLLVMIIGSVYIYERSRGRCRPGTIKIDTKGKKVIRSLIWALLLIPLVFIICGLIISIYNYQEYLDKDWANFKELMGPMPPSQISMPQSKDVMIDPEYECENDLNKKCRFVNVDNVTNLLSNIYDKNVQLSLELIEWIDYLRLFYGEMTTFLFSTAGGRQLVQETNFSQFNILSLQADEIFHARIALKNLRLLFGYIVESNKSQSIQARSDNRNKRSRTGRSQSYLDPYKTYRKNATGCPPVLPDFQPEYVLLFDVVMLMVFIHVIIIWLLLIIAFVSGLCKESNSCYKWTAVYLLSSLYLIFLYFLIFGSFTIAMYTYIIYLDYEGCNVQKQNPKQRYSYEARNNDSDYENLLELPRYNEIIAQLNVPYLQDVFVKIYKYVTRDIPNNHSQINLTTCHLNRLKNLVIGSFAAKDLFQKGSDLAYMCKQLALELNNVPADCYVELNKLKTCDLASSRENPGDNSCMDDWGNPCPYFRYYLLAMWSGIFLIMLALLPAIFMVLSLSKMYPWYNLRRIKASQKKNQKRAVGQATQTKHQSSWPLYSNQEDVSRTGREKFHTTVLDDLSVSNQKLAAKIHPKIRKDAHRLYQELGAICKICKSPYEGYDGKLALSENRHRQTKDKFSSKGLSNTSLGAHHLNLRLDSSQSSQLCRQATNDYCPIADSLNECFDGLVYSVPSRSSVKWHPPPRSRSKRSLKSKRKPKSVLKSSRRSSSADSIPKLGHHQTVYKPFSDPYRPSRRDTVRKSDRQSARKLVRLKDRHSKSLLDTRRKSFIQSVRHPLACNNRLLCDAFQKPLRSKCSSLVNVCRCQSPARFNQKRSHELSRKSLRESYRRSDRKPVKKTKRSKDRRLVSLGNNAQKKSSPISPKSANRFTDTEPIRKSRRKSVRRSLKSGQSSFRDINQKSKRSKHRSTRGSYSDSDSLSLYDCVLEIDEIPVVIPDSKLQSNGSSPSKEKRERTFKSVQVSASEASLDSAFKNSKNLPKKSKRRSLSRSSSICRCPSPPVRQIAHKSTCISSLNFTTFQSDERQEKDKQKRRKKR